MANIDDFQAADWDPNGRQAKIRELGYTGEFRDGKADQWLNQNYGTVKVAGLTNKFGSTTSLNAQMANSINNPVLPTGATLTPQTMAVQAGEIQQLPTPVTVSNLPPVATAVAPTALPTAQASTVGTQVDPNSVATGLTAPTYDATMVSAQTPQAVAAQGQVSELATVQGQLKKLYADTQDGETPLWAKGAVSQANEAMSARGLGASSIAAGAITAAVQASAIQIAAPDATTYFQMDLTNLNNEQTTRLENLRVRQQSLLSDQAADNASKQFNASSEAQLQQFQAQLVANITTQNADRVAAINQFNAAETNKQTALGAQLTTDVSKFNAQQQEARAQFYGNLKYQADAFNANMAQVIEQSNVTWRRNINTANTAAVNASNQSNVTNAFNLSSYALNALWQKSRDEADWVFQSSTNAQEQMYKLAEIAARTQGSLTINGDKQDFDTETAYYQTLGNVFATIFGGSN